MSSELLQQILSEIKNIHNSINRLEEGQTTLKEDVKVLKEDVRDLKEGQEVIKNKLDEFEVKNANKHLEIFNKIDIVSKDIRFIKQKEYQNEQELFTIKDYLKIIK